MLDSLDALIEEAATYAEIAAGTPRPYLAAHADARTIAVLADCQNPTANSHNLAEWSKAEEQFVLENMRWMSDEEMGVHLGRTAYAIKVYRFRHLDYTQRRKDPEWPTLQQVMVLMGVKCQKTVAMWVNQGLIPARFLPTGTDEIRAISLTTLYRWAVNPENWIYFKPERVVDPHLKRLLELRRQRWDDAWWTPGQVGAYHGVTHMAINNRINAGTLPAKRWGNWWIKRSDAMNLRIYPEKGASCAIEWTDAADSFLILARAIGFTWAAIQALCKWPKGRAPMRMKKLHERGAIPRLIAKYDLKVQYNPVGGDLLACLSEYPGRFKRPPGV